MFGPLLLFNFHEKSICKSKIFKNLGHHFMWGQISISLSAAALCDEPEFHFFGGPTVGKCMHARRKCAGVWVWQRDSWHATAGTTLFSCRGRSSPRVAELERVIVLLGWGEGLLTPSTLYYSILCINAARSIASYGLGNTSCAPLDFHAEKEKPRFASVLSK